MFVKNVGIFGGVSGSLDCPLLGAMTEGGERGSSSLVRVGNVIGGGKGDGALIVVFGYLRERAIRSGSVLLLVPQFGPFFPTRSCR